MTRIALGLVLLFAVLAFGATEPWALSATQIAIFILGILRCRRLGLPLLLGPVLWGLGQLAAGLTEYRWVTVNAVLLWSAWLALAAVARDLLSEERAHRAFLQGVLWAGAAIALEALLQHFTAAGRIYWLFPTRSERSFGPFVNPDHYAAFMELLLPLALVEAARGRRLAGLGITGLFYASVIASGSRAGAVLATAEVVLIPILVRGRKAALPALAALAAALIVGWQPLWARFQLRDPLRYRREMALAALEMIRDRPWTGFGLGTFETVYPAYARFDTGERVDHAHNDWLEWTAEGGLPFLAILLATVALGPPSPRNSPWCWGVYAVGVHSLVDFPLQIPGIMALVVVLLWGRPPTRGRSGRTPPPTSH
ncbi:MAG: O-antigen ligase family protein [Acidobacteria bacterium]|nr:O-antigen ligase family protein [Acidobacteriota bacterium]